MKRSSKAQILITSYAPSSSLLRYYNSAGYLCQEAFYVYFPKIHIGLFCPWNRRKFISNCL